MNSSQHSSNVIHVNLKKAVDDSYDIYIEKDVFKRIPRDLKSTRIGNKYAIISDSNVSQLYGRQLVDALEDEKLDACLLNFPAGEESKNLKTVEDLTKKLVNNGLDRKSLIIALGGGVVGDVAGFVASIYMRGIPYTQVPTTLIAQVDSSVGGKTAVDLLEGKNLIGAFYQPRSVYIDPTILYTLPEREVRNGIAEIIKHGVIYDKALFEYLENEVEEIKRLDIERLIHIVYRSCQIKSEIVQQDEKEENLRTILNYGHTFGHAEEKCGKYKHHLHGEAVSIGMNFAGNLALKMGLWHEKDLQRQNMLIRLYDLPLQSEFNLKELLDAMRHDKKGVSGKIMFVLPEQIGKMAEIDGKYRIPVAEKDLISVLHDLTG